MSHQHYVNTCPKCEAVSTCRCSGPNEVKTSDICYRCKEKTETTASTAVGATDGPALDLMPFKKHGRSKAPKLKKARGDWKTLTVQVHPWKKAEGNSGYEVANAYLNCESIEFFDGLMAEAAVNAAWKAMLAKKKDWTWAEARPVVERSEALFEEWRVRTIRELAEKGIRFLNDHIEIVVREVHSLTEGLNADFDFALAGAVKLEEDALYFNPNYHFIFEALEGAEIEGAKNGDVTSALKKLFALFDPVVEIVTEDALEGIDKISDHLKATL